MKIKSTRAFLSLLFFFNGLFDQSSKAQQLHFPFLDEASQRRIVVTVCDLEGDGQLCPSEYTNSISNTNFFSKEQQYIFRKISTEYKNVTTNIAPTGAILYGFVKTNYLNPYTHRTFERWEASVRFTNVEDRIDDIIFFNNGGFGVRFRSESGEEYKLTMRNALVQSFSEVKDGGFQADFENSHLTSLRYFSKGLEVGKCFVWNPRNGNLMLEANFKEPVDVKKHTEKGSVLEWENSRDIK